MSTAAPSPFQTPAGKGSQLQGQALRRPRKKRRRGSRLSPRTTWTAVIAGTALIGATVVVTGADGFTPTTFELSANSAWLPSFTVGQVALVDGTTADTVAKVQIVKKATALDVVQSGSTAFVINKASGMVTRVDGATLATVNAQPFPDSQSLQAYAGKESLYLYDRDRGALATMDAGTLAVRRKTSLDPAPNENSTLVDGRGRFWNISSRDGSLNFYDALGNRSSAAKVDNPAESQLVTVRNRPVLVESARSQVREIDQDSGKLGEETCVAGVGHRLHSAGSPTRDVVYFSDGQAGSLLTSDLTKRSCEGFIQISPPNSDLGPPLEAAGHVFIADRTHSTVAIVNPITGKLITVSLPVTPREPFDLLTHSGMVWYNQPRTERAGVITVDGRHLDTKKYDPKHPGSDVPGASTVTKTSGAQSTRNPQQQPGAQVSPTASPSPGTEPQASPTASGGPADLKIYMDPPPSPELGKSYAFKVTASKGKLTAATWDFGDHSTGSGLNVTHVYNEAKTYLVTVKGTFADGSQSTATITLTVHAKPAVQITSISPSEAKQDVPTTFRATFKNGPPKSYLWNVLDPDNKTIFTSNDPTPSFTFTSPTPDAGRPYMVTLVVDNDFVGGQGAQNVTVGPTRPAGVSASCSRDSLVLGETVRCSATASGSFVTWRWVVNGPDGSVSVDTGESPDLSYVAPRKGDYTVQAIASNRTGPSDPSPPVGFSVRETAFENLACTPAPVRAELPARCILTFNGFLDSFTFARWEMVEPGGSTISGSNWIPVGSQQFMILPTFPTAGTYALSVTYLSPLSGRITLRSGTVEVASAPRTVKVKVIGEGEVKEGSNSCSGTCTWNYSDGERINLRAIAPGDTHITWEGACNSNNPNCSFTVGRENSVTVRFRAPAVLSLEVRGTTDSCSNGSRAHGAQSNGDPSSGDLAERLQLATMAASVPLADEGDEETTTTTTTTTTTEPEEPKEPEEPTTTTTTTTNPPCESNLGKGNVHVKENGRPAPSCAERATGVCTYRAQTYVQWELFDSDPRDNYKVSWTGCSWTDRGRCFVHSDNPGDRLTVKATFRTERN